MAQDEADRHISRLVTRRCAPIAVRPVPPGERSSAFCIYLKGDSCCLQNDGQEAREWA